MARITDLPPEIIESILWSLDSVHSLAAALRSCHRLYAFVQQSEKMALAIFCRKIGPAVLPYVVALDESYGCHDDPGLFLKYIKTYLNDTNARLAESEESHNRSESHIDDSDEPPDDFEEPPDDFEESPDASDEEIEDFDPEESDDTDTYRERFFAARYRATHTLLKTLYDRPTVFVDTLESITVYHLLNMERKNNATHAFVTEFAEFAWNRLRENDGSLPRTITLSSTERDRLCRAFYRLDIFYVLFGNEEIQQYHRPKWNDWFFSKHSPWENEQIACVYHFLEIKFAQASYDVVAHDVEFGVREVDYLTSWQENESRQLWLSQGVEFIYDLATQETYDSKKKWLRMYLREHINFPRTLNDVKEDQFSMITHRGLSLIDVEWVGRRRIRTTKERLFSHVLRKDNDCDIGPRLLVDGNEWHRECAYLFWDWTRVEKYQFLSAWERPPVVFCLNYRPKGLKEMQIGSRYGMREADDRERHGTRKVYVRTCATNLGAILNIHDLETWRLSFESAVIE
ncbi:unnamed protein product [Colletotrichum noveboracense]|uniref:F-box domain-containing protein n=1 Tax=Colletotrichum noveboracense TaxID=2664923 RepID=A0A9W4S6F1_9PEZI|nr:unnamed protein product [Colletotrichum noveboracense]